MDAASLFQSLTSKPETPASNIITGTAVGSSEDGMVLVQVDGSAVAQPSDEEVTLTISTDEFAGGSYQLPSAPYPGTIVLKDSTDAIVDEDDYYIDGDQLTIEALDLPPVEIAYTTEVRQALTNDDFASGSITVDSTTNLALLEDMGGADWQPCAYTLDGNELTVAGIETKQGLVEFVYVRSVSLVCETGLNVLPDMPDPDDVAVTGRVNNTDYIVTTWTLEQDQLTLPSGYDAFVVDYIINETEQWNITEQYLDEPLQDSDEAADPTVITVGHDLQYEPDTVTSCTVDGVSATYTLAGVNVIADSPAVAERYFTLTYDTPVELEVPASEFAVGSYTLPSEPTGAVVTTSNGSTLANSVSGLELSIPSLIATSASYTIAYTAQVENDVVELPCTPAVSEGQFVDIAIVNGMPTVIGASGSGDAVAAAADAAEAAATAAEAVANAVNQHFWTDGSGVHVTEVTQEDWLDPLSPNYQSGANQLSNSAGILLRDGLTNFAQLTPGETAFYDGAGNASTNVVATFGTSGSVIGKAAESHAFIDYHSLQLVDKEGSTYFYVSDLRDGTGVATITETLLGHSAELSYRVTLPVTTASECSVKVNGTSVTFSVADGDRTFTLDSPPAEFSTIEITYNTTDQNAKAYTLGFRTGAAGPMSLAVGPDAEAAGGYSYAGGRMAKAWGRTAYATGDHTTAWGYASTAEGNYTNAFGGSSHAQNEGTQANGEAQTTLGRYNVTDTTSAVIIGNGTTNNTRSNALTVDWSGNVGAAGKVDAANIGNRSYTGDLNDLTDTGIYYVGSAATNGPIASTGGQLAVTSNAGSANVTQMFTTYASTTSVWVRRYLSGSWSAWQLVSDTRPRSLTQSVQVGSFFYRAASYITLLIPITNPNDQYTTVATTNLPASITCRDVADPASTTTITLSSINSETVQHGYVALRINCTGGTSTHTYVVSSSFNVTLALS